MAARKRLRSVLTTLMRFADMDEPLKAFVMKRTKRCDGCGYCTQTDKAGKRPKAFVPIGYGGKTENLCTYFPGCNYCWTRLTNEIAENIIRLLSFIDPALIV